MKIGLYDPYLDTLGGGERYILSIASCFGSEDNITLFWDDQRILREAEAKFGIDLGNVSIQKNIFSPHVSLPYRFFKTREFDAFFYISDGSIPFLGAKKIFPVMQFPFKDYQSRNLISTIKQRNVKTILCYSAFVRDLLNRQGMQNISIVPPPVILMEPLQEKEKIILSVGRFTKGNNAKKQEVLIDFFKKNEKFFSGWKLVLVGSVLPQDKDFLSILQKKCEGSKISIVSDASFSDLEKYYQKAIFYWHAAGFGEDLVEHPEKAEHFGISTVEAMSAGCVPLVFAGGGQKEVVRDGVDGLLWTTLDELLEKTSKLMREQKMRDAFAKSAMQRAKEFDAQHFCRNIKALL